MNRLAIRVAPSRGLFAAARTSGGQSKNAQSATPSQRNAEANKHGSGNSCEPGKPIGGAGAQGHSRHQHTLSNREESAQHVGQPNSSGIQAQCVIPEIPAHSDMSAAMIQG